MQGPGKPQEEARKIGNVAKKYLNKFNATCRRAGSPSAGRTLRALLEEARALGRRVDEVALSVDEGVGKMKSEPQSQLSDLDASLRAQRRVQV